MEILSTVLTRTPIWVWPLLVILLWLGLSRSKTRDATPIQLLIPPIVFGGLAVVKLALSGLAPTYLIGTLSGLALGVLLVMWLRPARAATRLPTGKIRIEGEWISLVIIMLVFATNYIAGVMASVAPQMMASANILFAIALINTFSAALMAGRAYAYLHTKHHVATPASTVLQLEG